MGDGTLVISGFLREQRVAEARRIVAHCNATEDGLVDLMERNAEVRRRARAVIETSGEALLPNEEPTEDRDLVIARRAEFARQHAKDAVAKRKVVRS